MKIAGIDIGTNTTRLIIFDTEKNKVLLKERIITRLGENFNGRIILEAKNRLIQTLKKYKEIMSKFNVKKYKAIATSVVRESNNQEKFIKDIFKNTEIKIEIIDGKKEAELTLKGVLWALNDKINDFLLLDIGGGSNEYSLIKDRNLIDSVSLKFGVVFLYEKFIKNDPPKPEELTSMINEIHINLEKVKEKLGEISENFAFVGTAGTITTIAAIHQKLTTYKPELINNHYVPIKFVKKLINDMLKLTNAERLKIYNIEKGREDVIIPGILITLKTMEFFGFKGIISIDSGLLEGIVLDIL